MAIYMRLLSSLTYWSEQARIAVARRHDALEAAAAVVERQGEHAPALVYALLLLSNVNAGEPGGPCHAVPGQAAARTQVRCAVDCP